MAARKDAAMDAPPPLEDQPAWRDALEHRAAKTRQALDEGTEGDVTLDQTRVGRLSRMDALANQALAQAAQRRREATLKALEAALTRLESGQFGYCLSCDEPIALPRLWHNPAVTLCLGCAAEAER
jgi:DnaK suppressor protein